jgi:Tfp pilus assembly protein PilX
MGLVGMFFSTVAIAAGAVMYWAITTTQGHGFRLSTVGVILMVVGAIGLVASAIVFSTSRSSAGSRHHTYDREATDSLGRSTEVHEEVH